MTQLKNIASVLLVCLFFCVPSVRAAETVQLGASIPVTGEYAGYGEVFKNAFDLALENINADGGINGRPLEIMIEDSQGNPAVSKRIARNFCRNVITSYSIHYTKLYEASSRGARLRFRAGPGHRSDRYRGLREPPFPPAQGR